MNGSLPRSPLFRILHERSLARMGGSHGFSLIELLVVMAMLGVLAVAALPAVGSNLGAINLSGAAQRLADELAQARQTAIVQNRSVELRIYRESSGADQDEYRRTAIVLTGGGAEFLSSGQEWPQGIVSDKDATYSSALSGSAQTEGVSAPGRLRGMEYRAVRFLPSGRVEVDGASSTPYVLTLRAKNARSGDGKPADNYVAFVLDPLTGRANVYQP